MIFSFRIEVLVLCFDDVVGFVTQAGFEDRPNDEARDPKGEKDPRNSCQDKSSVVRLLAL